MKNELSLALEIKKDKNIISSEMLIKNKILKPIPEIDMGNISTEGANLAKFMKNE